MRRLTLLMVLVAFVFSCGGQWAVLQGIAWANMVREYSTMVPVTRAVAMTFSGEYPCSICKMIAERKNTENSKIATLEKQEKKILSASLLAATRSPNSVTQTFCVRDEFLRSLTEPPPVPPPRLA